MTQLGINHAPTRENGNGWKTTAMGGLFTVLLLVAGWIATSAQTDKSKLTERVDEQAQRIAILEESVRNMRASQDRVERGVDDIRRQLQERRFR